MVAKVVLGLTLLLVLASAAHAQSSRPFQVASPIVLEGSEARAMAIGDYDGDGDQDLLTTKPALDDVTPWRNTSNVFLSAATTTFGGGTAAAISMVAADMDGDGRQDAVVGTTDGSDPAVEIFRGQASGTLASPIQLPFVGLNGTGASAAQVAVGDLDGNGRPDLVVTGCRVLGMALNCGYLYRLQTGPLTFAPPSFGTITTPAQPEIADVDGDGDRDVAIQGDGGIHLLRNPGSGVLEAPTFLVTVSGAQETNAGTLWDADADGDVDLATFVREPGGTPKLNVRSNDGSGAFGPIVESNLPGRASASPQQADVNADGFPDLVLYSRDALPGNFDAIFAVTAGFRSTNLVLFGALGPEPFNDVPDALALGDLSGDGLADLAFTTLPQGGSNGFRIQIAVNQSLAQVRGTPAPPGVLDFGDVVSGSGRSLQASLVNTGKVSVTASTPRLEGPADFTIAKDDCTGKTLEPGTDCQVTVRFTPTGVGAKTARVVLAADTVDGDAPVDLEGTGIAPPVGATTTVTVPGPSPTPTIPSPTPTPTPLNPTQVLVLPSTKTCVSRRLLRLKVKVPKGAKIKSVATKVGGAKTVTRTGGKARPTVDLRGLPKGRVKVVITVTFTDGRKVRAERTYRTCAPRKLS